MTRRCVKYNNYNIRGWLTSKSSPAFSMSLNYFLNGNISSWGDYAFNYDAVNRLVSADSASGYSENGISYDRNGNITTLQRTANHALVDNLAYTYDGNRLSGLGESVAGAPAGDVFAQNGTDIGVFTYDPNGNMTFDSRKNLSFGYNLLNLLDNVQSNGAMKAKYTWLADGTKLRARDASGRGFDYVGSLTYNSTGLEHAQFSHGVIRAGQGSGSTSNQEINYHITDHLGSVRAVIDGSGAVREKNDYYAFGAKHVRPDYPQNTNRFDFNGKESQDALGLSFLDYGARMYNPELGRWFNIDPLAEKYYPFSGYHFSQNNPLIFVDNNGASSDWYSMVDGNGNINYHYTTEYRSQKDLDRAGIKGKYLGLTYTDNNKGKYYSLLGDIFDFNTGNRTIDIQAEIIANLDKALMNYYKPPFNEWGEVLSHATNLSISMAPLSSFKGSINTMKAMYQGGEVWHSLYVGNRNGTFDWGKGELRTLGGYFDKGIKPTVNALVETTTYNSNSQIINWQFPNKAAWLKAQQKAEKLFKGRY